ncbi:MAG: hypothetical protein ACJAT1_000625 [Marivirga sp.]|jgi:hypothetical protein
MNNKSIAQGFGGVHLSNEFAVGSNRLLLGGGGAWIINQHFYLGGAGDGSHNTVLTEQSEALSLGYGGLLVIYTIKRKR